MPRYGFESFVVFPSNRDAYRAVRAWVRGRLSRTMLLIGPPGVGKTHLGQAAVAVLERRGESSRVASVELVMRDYVSALRASRIANFRQRWGDLGVLVLEHVQELSGKERTLDEIVRLVTERRLHGHQTLITATVTHHSLQNWSLRLAALCGAHPVGIKQPRSAELAAFAAGFHAPAAADRHWWDHCTNVAEVVGEHNRRALAGAL